MAEQEASILKHLKQVLNQPSPEAGCSARGVYDAATALWWHSGTHFQAQGAPGLPGPSSDSGKWDEERALLEGAIYTLQEIHRYRYLKNAAGQTPAAQKEKPNE